MIRIKKDDLPQYIKDAFRRGDTFNGNPQQMVGQPKQPGSWRSDTALRGVSNNTLMVPNMVFDKSRLARAKEFVGYGESAIWGATSAFSPKGILKSGQAIKSGVKAVSKLVKNARGASRGKPGWSLKVAKRSQKLAKTAAKKKYDKDTLLTDLLYLLLQ